MSNHTRFCFPQKDDTNTRLWQHLVSEMREFYTKVCFAKFGCTFNDDVMTALQQDANNATAAIACLQNVGNTIEAK